MRSIIVSMSSYTMNVFDKTNSSNSFRTSLYRVMLSEEQIKVAAQKTSIYDTFKVS